MKVLITGASGFLGSHVVEYILSTTDWSMVLVESLRQRALSLGGEKDRIEYFQGDLRWPIPDRMFSGVDYVVNVASGSEVSDSLKNPAAFIQNNVTLTTNLLEVARESKTLKGFIHISTGEVYGPAEHGVDHHEWSPIVTHSPYSASKACQEAILTAYWKSFRVPVAILNTMNVFGERQSPTKFIPLVVNAIKKGEPVQIHGTEERPTFRRYIHAKNVADAICCVIRNYIYMIPGHTVPARYNVVGDVELSNHDLARRIGSMMGKTPLFQFIPSDRPGHDSRYSLDGAKIKGFGWKAPIPFGESLAQTVKHLNA